MSRSDTPIWDGTRVLGAPSFTWGSRVANAPPNIQGPFGNFILDTRVYNFNASLTKVMGSHTVKTGYYYFNSYQRRGQGAILGIDQLPERHQQPARLRLRVRQRGARHLQLSTRSCRAGAKAPTPAINHEAFIQDNWKVRDNLTLDYGVRFVHQVPQYDGYGKSSNFLPDEWTAAQAPVLYVAGCANGVYPCTGTNRQAMNPLTGQFLGPNSAAAIGTLVPNTGNLDQRRLPGGQGIAETNYDVSGARRRAARRRGVGRQRQPEVRRARQRRPVLRSAAGAERLQHGQQPAVHAQRHGALRPAAGSEQRRPHHRGAAGADRLAVRQAAAELGAVEHRRRRWRCRSTPCSTSPTPGSTATDSRNAANINAIDFGTAFLPSTQDPTQTSTVPGAASIAALNPDLARYYRGYGSISQQQAVQWRTYHSLQVSLNRRLINGLALGFTDTISLYDRQLAPLRLQHNADGTDHHARRSGRRPNELLGNNNPQTHIMRANFVWQLPRLNAAARASCGRSDHILNDWSLSGIWSAATGAAYAVTPSVHEQRRQREPHRVARLRARASTSTGDPGARLQLGSAAPVQHRARSPGPLPGSVGLESGNGYLRGCFVSQMDLAIARTIRLGVGSSSVQLRLDVFNVFNQAAVTNRNTTMQLASPSAPNGDRPTCRSMRTAT